MKRVLIFSDSRLFGGSEHAVINLLKNDELKKDVQYTFAYRKHKLYQKKVSELLEKENCVDIFPVKLYTNYGIADFLNQHINNTLLYKICYLPFYIIEKIGLYDLLNRFILRRLITNHKFDVVHINNGGYPGARSCLLLAEECSKKNIKVILQVNNIAKESGDPRIDNIVKTSTDIFITASRVAGDILGKILDIPDSKQLIIPHYVEKKTGSKTRKEICEITGISESSIIIVEVALLQKRKGQVELVKAVSLLSERLNKKIDLILIGEGENKETIIDTINECGISKRVHLLGYKNNYIDYLNAADIVTLPSLKDEDMPLILISALSLGKSIVSTKLAGIPEEIEDGVSGILIDPLSENFVLELADALLTAYRYKETLSKNALLRYNQIFSKEKFIESYKKLYSSL